MYKILIWDHRYAPKDAVSWAVNINGKIFIDGGSYVFIRHKDGTTQHINLSFYD